MNIYKPSRNRNQQQYGIVYLRQLVTENLSPQEAIILRDLLENKVCSANRLTDQLWPRSKRTTPPPTSSSVIRVHIHIISKKLNYQWKIDKVRNKIYRLTRSNGIQSQFLDPHLPKE